MTALNVVAVTFAADPSPEDIPSGEGYVIASPDGVEWPDGNDNPIVPMEQRGDLKSGTCTLNLVASDNFDTGVLTWDFIVNIRGFKTVSVQQVPVNYASGASQNGWDILSAAGWTPT